MHIFKTGNKKIVVQENYIHIKMMLYIITNIIINRNTKTLVRCQKHCRNIIIKYSQWSLDAMDLTVSVSCLGCILSQTAINTSLDICLFYHITFAHCLTVSLPYAVFYTSVLSFYDSDIFYVCQYFIHQLSLYFQLL